LTSCHLQAVIQLLLLLLLLLPPPRFEGQLSAAAKLSASASSCPILSAFIWAAALLTPLKEAAVAALDSVLCTFRQAMKSAPFSARAAASWLGPCSKAWMRTPFTRHSSTTM
jgi:hypothetical protein